MCTSLVRYVLLYDLFYNIRLFDVDPKYTGFKPLADDHAVPVDDLIKSRNLYFKECTSIGKQFVDDIVKDRKQFYDTKLENRVTVIKGVIFIVTTCILDWIVCAM